MIKALMMAEEIIWLEPWDPKCIPKIKRLLKQLTDDKDIISRFSHTILKQMFICQETYIATIWEKDGKTLVGMGTIIFNQTMLKRFGFIEDVVVNKKHRRKGYAEKITRALIQKAKNAKIDRIDLTSNPRRKAANALYHKLGFVRRDKKTNNLSLYLT